MDQGERESAEYDDRVIVAFPGASIVTKVLVVLALLLVVLGFAVADNAITQAAFFASAAVFAILARIAQASKQHEELIDELRRR